MHLRTLCIRGFKSFPDPLEMTLEPGVAVIVGPKRSDKSNIADAIVWAGELRAAVVIGALAGLLPALHAARLSPAEALRTVPAGNWSFGVQGRRRYSTSPDSD